MRQRKLLSCDQGQSVVELALALPVLLLLVLGTIDLGMGFRTYIALTNAAREGVRWVSVRPDDVDGALARVAVEADRIGLSAGELSAGGYAPSFVPEQAVYSAGDEVTLNIRYDYELMFGLITGLPEVPFTAHATMVVLYTPPSP
jgi:Flp pilus assembly protein TadG